MTLPLPQAAYEVTAEEHRSYLVDWQAKCYEAGLIATDVAKEYGGHGHTGFQQIASAEVRRAEVPYFINWIGLGMTAPTLLIHGTEEHKRSFSCRRYSPPKISGARVFPNRVPGPIWCRCRPVRSSRATAGW